MALNRPSVTASARNLPARTCGVTGGSAVIATLICPPRRSVTAGAPPEILYAAKPHIGTFRLVGMVETMRATIESLGGEFRFQNRITDIEIENGQTRGVVLGSGEHIASEHVVLAVGHSARDTFQMLHARGVYLEAKPFSIGFRIEHPQSLIDRARWGVHAGHPLLGAADYKLVHHAANGRAVYSFCMCPGGTVVAATSEPGRVVTNGMSQYSRNERNANAGIVVGIDPRDYALVAFGGAGPLHGAEVADMLGIPEVIVPPHPGITSAVGLLISDLRYDAIRTSFQVSGAADLARRPDAIAWAAPTTSIAPMRTNTCRVSLRRMPSSTAVPASCGTMSRAAVQSAPAAIPWRS